MKPLLRLTGVVAAIALTLGLATAPAAAQDKKVRVQMGWAFPSTTGLLGPTQTRLVETLRTISGGSIDIKFFEPGALVPASQSFDAVGNGSLDAAWATPGFWTGKDIAFAMYSTGAVRPGHGRIPRLDEVRRRREDAAGALRQVQHPRRDLRASSRPRPRAGSARRSRRWTT